MDEERKAGGGDGGTRPADGRGTAGSGKAGSGESGSGESGSGKAARVPERAVPSEAPRVLLIANTLPPADVSGVGEQVLQLAAGLRTAGCRVEVLGRREAGAAASGGSGAASGGDGPASGGSGAAPGGTGAVAGRRPPAPDPADADRAVGAGPAGRSAAGPRPPATADPYGLAPEGAAGPKVLFPLAVLPATWRALRRFRPHVVQVHESDGALAALLVRLLRPFLRPRPRLVALLQVSYVEERRAVRPLVAPDGRVMGEPGEVERRFRRGKGRLQVLLGRLTARLADRVLAPSERTAGEIRRDYRVRSVAVLPNVTGGLPVAAEPLPGELARAAAGALLFVGRLRIRKGVEVLLEALAHLPDPLRPPTHAGEPPPQPPAHTGEPPPQPPARTGEPPPQPPTSAEEPAAGRRLEVRGRATPPPVPDTTGAPAAAAPLLLIAGDGEHRAALEARAAELGLLGGAEGADRVRFLGRCSAGRVRALLARCRALVVPSTYEGMPLVILEAMEAAVPVVASDVSGIPEVVVDGETGWVVPAEDPEALARALAEALAAPAAAPAAGTGEGSERRGRAGRRRLDGRYRPAHAAARWLEAVLHG